MSIPVLAVIMHILVEALSQSACAEVVAKGVRGQSAQTALQRCMKTPPAVESTLASLRDCLYCKFADFDVCKHHGDYELGFEEHSGIFAHESARFLTAMQKDGVPQWCLDDEFGLVHPWGWTVSRDGRACYKNDPPLPGRRVRSH